MAYDQTFGTTADARIPTGLLKYDGREVCVSGMPYCGKPTLAIPGGGSTLGIGRYRYLAEIVSTDAQGNEVHGNASDLIGEALVTTTTGNTNITVTIPHPAVNDFEFFGFRTATISGAHGPATHFHVSAGSNLRTGDPVYFRDSSGVIQCRTITSLTDTDVYISGAAVTVSNTGSLAHVSTKLINVYRTKVGGTFYYLAQQLPCFDTANMVYTDALADTGLGAQWEGPFLGTQRRDLPPVCRLIENHQGLLVAAGDPERPQDLFWSSSESPEYWSRSTNYQEVLSTEEGQFTALASSQDDTLLVFKRKSFLPVVGNITAGSFSILAENQGDVGVPNSGAVIKMRNYLVAMSEDGPRKIQGADVALYDQRLNEIFDSTGSLFSSLEMCGAFKDTKNSKLYFSFMGTQAVTGTTVFFSCVLDYKNPFSPWSYFLQSEDVNSWGRGGVVDDELYFLSRPYATSGGVRNALYQRNSSKTAYDYVDNHLPISYVFKTHWESCDEPSLSKTFNEVCVWVLNNSPFVPTTITFKTYRNFNDTIARTVKTLPFTTASLKDVVVPLMVEKSKALQIEFSCSTPFECPHIAGYEVKATARFNKEHLLEQSEL